MTWSRRDPFLRYMGKLQVGKLSTCPALVRLDLSRNQLSSLAGLETCPQLKWLSASGNPLSDLGALHALSNLRVGPFTAITPCTLSAGGSLEPSSVHSRSLSAAVDLL